MRIARSRILAGKLVFRRELSHVPGRRRGEEKKNKCDGDTDEKQGGGAGRGWPDRLVFSIYSRGEKLNRIRCRRIRVSIFHKIGEKPNTGKLRFKKYTGLYFLCRYAIFFQNFVRDPRSPGKTRKNYRYTRKPAAFLFESL